MLRLALLSYLLTALTSAYSQGYAGNQSLFLSKYPSEYELEAWLRSLEQNQCQGLMKVETFGKSAAGKPLWVAEISDKLLVDDAKPRFKYMGNLHGDEPLGRSLLPAFALFLCESFNRHKARPPVGPPGSVIYAPSVSTEEGRSILAYQLVRSSRIFLAPSLNPDGFEKQSRGNLYDIDLNRNFPDPIRDRIRSPELEPFGKEQPEALAVMGFVRSRHFVVSAALHEGAVVANYPWDATTNGMTRYHGCPDDAAYRHLASTYSLHHPTMFQSAEFPGGITNGADWYPVYGGMQDWNYIKGRCLELTLELSDDKWPDPSLLPSIFEANLPPMLLFPWAGMYGGAWGRVVQAQGGLRVDGDAGAAAAALASLGRRLRRAVRRALLQSGEGPTRRVRVIQGATIEVAEVPGGVMLQTGVHGDFYRPLAPGSYTLRVKAPGHAERLVPVTVPADYSGAPVLVELTPLRAARVARSGLQVSPGGDASAAGSSLGRAMATDGTGTGFGALLGSLGSLVEVGTVDASLGGAGGAEGGASAAAPSSGATLALFVLAVVVPVTVAVYYMVRKKLSRQKQIITVGGDDLSGKFGAAHRIALQTTNDVEGGAAAGGYRRR